MVHPTSKNKILAIPGYCERVFTRDAARRSRNRISGYFVRRETQKPPRKRRLRTWRSLPLGASKSRWSTVPIVGKFAEAAKTSRCRSWAAAVFQKPSASLLEAWLHYWQIAHSRGFLGVSLHCHHGELVRQPAQHFAHKFQLSLTGKVHSRNERKILCIIAAQKISWVKN